MSPAPPDDRPVPGDPPPRPSDPAPPDDRGTASAEGVAGPGPASVRFRRPEPSLPAGTARTAPSPAAASRAEVEWVRTAEITRRASTALASAAYRAALRVAAARDALARTAIQRARAALAARASRLPARGGAAAPSETDAPTRQAPGR